MGILLPLFLERGRIGKVATIDFGLLMKIIKMNRKNLNHAENQVEVAI